MTKIINTNNLSNPNVLHVGQKLIIPGKPQENTKIMHTVTVGESQWLISQKYNVSVDHIIKTNITNNPNMLYVGQELIIK